MAGRFDEELDESVSSGGRTVVPPGHTTSDSERVVRLASSTAAGHGDFPSASFARRGAAPPASVTFPETDYAEEQRRRSSSTPPVPERPPSVGQDVRPAAYGSRYYSYSQPGPPAFSLSRSFSSSSTGRYGRYAYDDDEGAAGVRGEEQAYYPYPYRSYGPQPSSSASSSFEPGREEYEYHHHRMTREAYAREQEARQRFEAAQESSSQRFVGGFTSVPYPSAPAPASFGFHVHPEYEQQHHHQQQQQQAPRRPRSGHYVFVPDDEDEYDYGLPPLRPPPISAPPSRRYLTPPYSPGLSRTTTTVGRPSVRGRVVSTPGPSSYFASSSSTATGPSQGGYRVDPGQGLGYGYGYGSGYGYDVEYGPRAEGFERERALHVDLGGRPYPGRYGGGRSVSYSGGGVRMGVVGAGVGADVDVGAGGGGRFVQDDPAQRPIPAPAPAPGQAAFPSEPSETIGAPPVRYQHSYPSSSSPSSGVQGYQIGGEYPSGTDENVPAPAPAPAPARGLGLASTIPGRRPLDPYGPEPLPGGGPLVVPVPAPAPIPVPGLGYSVPPSVPVPVPVPPGQDYGYAYPLPAAPVSGVVPVPVPVPGGTTEPVNEPPYDAPAPGGVEPANEGGGRGGLRPRALFHRVADEPTDTDTEGSSQPARDATTTSEPTPLVDDEGVLPKAALGSVTSGVHGSEDAPESPREQPATEPHSDLTDSRDHEELVEEEGSRGTTSMDSALPSASETTDEESEDSGDRIPEGIPLTPGQYSQPPSAVQTGFPANPVTSSSSSSSPLPQHSSSTPTQPVPHVEVDESGTTPVTHGADEPTGALPQEDLSIPQPPPPAHEREAGRPSHAEEHDDDHRTTTPPPYTPPEPSSEPQADAPSVSIDEPIPPPPAEAPRTEDEQPAALTDPAAVATPPQGTDVPLVSQSPPVIPEDETTLPSRPTLATPPPSSPPPPHGVEPRPPAYASTERVPTTTAAGSTSTSTSTSSSSGPTTGTNGTPASEDPPRPSVRFDDGSAGAIEPSSSSGSATETGGVIVVGSGETSVAGGSPPRRPLTIATCPGSVSPPLSLRPLVLAGTETVLSGVRGLVAGASHGEGSLRSSILPPVVSSSAQDGGYEILRESTEPEMSGAEHGQDSAAPFTGSASAQQPPADESERLPELFRSGSAGTYSTYSDKGIEVDYERLTRDTEAMRARFVPRSNQRDTEMYLYELSWPVMVLVLGLRWGHAVFVLLMGGRAREADVRTLVREGIAPFVRLVVYGRLVGRALLFAWVPPFVLAVASVRYALKALIKTVSHVQSLFFSSSNESASQRVHRLASSMFAPFFAAFWIVGFAQRTLWGVATRVIRAWMPRNTQSPFLSRSRWPSEKVGHVDDFDNTILLDQKSTHHGEFDSTYSMVDYKTREASGRTTRDADTRVVELGWPAVVLVAVLRWCYATFLDLASEQERKSQGRPSWWHNTKDLLQPLVLARIATRMTAFVWLLPFYMVLALVRAFSRAIGFRSFGRKGNMTPA